MHECIFPSNKVILFIIIIIIIIIILTIYYCKDLENSYRVDVVQEKYFITKLKVNILI